MKLLLDTHTLIWLIWGNTQLSHEALTAIQAPDYEKYVSIVTF